MYERTEDFRQGTIFGQLNLNRFCGCGIKIVLADKLVPDNTNFFGGLSSSQKFCRILHVATSALLYTTMDILFGYVCKKVFSSQTQMLTLNL
jgi:hypothetical protein